MDIRRLEIFLKLLDTRSFSKTASAFGLAQPSVSASLKALEDSLGQKLFERTPRSVTPLPAADILAPFALDIIETAGRAAWAISRQLANPREKLSLGASSVPALVIMPRAMAEFGRKYPNVSLRLATGQSGGIAQKVADGELDLAVVGAPSQNAELDCQPLARDKMVFMASESLAAQVGPAPAKMEDILAWPLILREDGSGTKAAFLTALGEKAGSLAGRLNIRAEVEGLDASLALVKASFGAMICSSLITAYIDTGGLVVSPLDFFGRRNFYVVRRKSSPGSPAMEAMLGFVKKAGQELKAAR